MRNDPIRIADIQKRQQRVNSLSTDKAAITEATISISKNKANREAMIERLFTLCCSTENAEKCMPYLIRYINEAHIYSAHYDTLVTCFVENIAPVIDDTQSAINEIAKVRNDKTRITLMEAINRTITIDKIIENHNKISKRFNIDSYVSERMFYTDPIDVSDQICEWIDTYNMPPHAKLQTAIEEAMYSLQKCGAEYDQASVLQNIVEYYLLSGEIKAADAKKVLESNKMISDKDTSDVRYLFNEYASDDISKAIQKCKQEELNDSTFNKVMNSLYTKSAEQLVDGLPNILSWIRRILVLSTLGANIILGAFIILIDKMIEMKLTRKQVDRVYNTLKSEKDKTVKSIAKAEGTKKEKLEKYSTSLDNAISELSIYRDKLYTEDELDNQVEIESEAVVNAPITLDEFQTFKFDKIADTVEDATKYIKTSYAKNNANAVVKPVIKSVPDEDVDKDGNLKKKPETPTNPNLVTGLKSIASHFTESLFDSNINLFDAVLVTFNVSESKAEKAYDFVSSICEDVNNRFGSKDLKFYSNTAGDNCEIHLVDTNPIMLTEAEKKCVGTFAESDINTVAEFYNLTDLIEAYVKYKPNEILSDLLKSDLGFEEAFIIMNLQKYSGINESDDMWDKVKDKYTNKNYDTNDSKLVNENTLLNNLSYEFNGKVMPFSIQVEACGLMRGILNESFDTSAVRVALQGMKTKVKNLSVKEKEVSRNMDVAANGFMRSVENALTNDRREAIIKGSIIPSFSKCVKTAIAAGGIAVIADPVVAVIGLIGSLAGSRYLNNRERMLLLDEIEVELKVVEKELQRAENEDDMAKYRRLLTYQKKLKKEDFKLRYNISRKLGKDYITRSGKGDDE